MVTCCVPTCGNSTRNFKLYVLPKDREVRSHQKVIYNFNYNGVLQ